MKQHPPLACFAGLCFALAACCNAATVTWTGGGGDGQWGNPENWSTGALPAEADSVSFPVDATLPDGRVKLGADRRVARLTFTGQNNAQYGYNRFEYLYLEDSLPDSERIRLTHKKICEFFGEEA